MTYSLITFLDSEGGTPRAGLETNGDVLPLTPANLALPDTAGGVTVDSIIRHWASA